MRIAGTRGKALATREHQQFVRKVRAANGCTQRVADDLAGSRVVGELVFKDLQIAADHRQQIVEIVRDAAGELPDPFQTLRMRQLVLHTNALHRDHEQVRDRLQEMQRVGKDKKWLCVESYRNEREKANLLYWQLTCESFYRPESWTFLFKEWGYDGDYGFIYFE